METQLKFIFEQIALVGLSVDKFFFEWIARTVQTDNNFFKRIFQALRMDDNFSQMDSPSCSNGWQFFFNGYPEPFKQMYQIRPKMANCKERFRVRDQAKELTKNMFTMSINP